jgi:hypothetical protein
MTYRPSFFDVPYSIASPTLTVGNTIIATTSCDYMGLAVIATSAGATVIIYDNASTALGNRLDVLTVSANVATNPTKSFIVKARKGIVASVTGTGASAVVFYGPKG